VELAAVVVVPGPEDLAVWDPQPCSFSSLLSPAVHSSLMPVLGNYVLRTWTERIYKLGVPRLWLTSDAKADDEIRSAVTGLARQGIERLLMIKLTSYAEIDLSDLLQFHCERRNTVTEAHDSRGQLGVCVYDQTAFPVSDNNNGAVTTNGERTLYPFRGYAKRILSACERQELVGDVLIGACAMRPRGKEICEQVWVGEGVNLADSVRVVGPTYIGDRTVVRAGATIGPFASIERDCLVDCGTSVERSTVLPGTYLAPGIMIRHALVDGGYLEDLRCGAIADLLPSGLAGSVQNLPHPTRTPDTTVVDEYPSFRTIASDFAPCSAEWREMRL
jgi:carbonic anhydrase/acetyltransferase-like protein (isoleucine patch superfamily)